MSLSAKTVRSLLARGGITLNGPNPWDMQIRDPRACARMLRAGSLGLGESYMAGWWDADKLDEFFARLLGSHLDRVGVLSPLTWVGFLSDLLINNASRKRAFVIGEAHYDLGNDFFQKMLDKRMVYTCAYWPEGVSGAEFLDQAQEAKLDLVCRKLNLQPGQKILDIGCGWGSFAKYAAEKYKVSVVGTTVSREQAELARELCAGLPVEIRLEDYRDTQGSFDHVVSLGMFEHVEPRNHRAYLQVASRCLKPGGLFLLHTIGKDSSYGGTDPWIKKYIFPLGVIPLPRQVMSAARGVFQILDWHRFGGSHYDRTLMAWHQNFTAHWPELEPKYKDKVNGQFERMWRYYLLVCAGSFRARKLNLWQLVLSRESIPYVPVR